MQSWTRDPFSRKGANAPAKRKHDVFGGGTAFYALGVLWSKHQTNVSEFFKIKFHAP